jgi:glutaredoxin
MCTFSSKMRVSSLFAAVFAAALGGAVGSADAQQTYRVVGPDGRVTFTDRPPADTNAKVSNARVPASAAADDTAGLPASLRPVVSRFPVTIYTSERCDPCAALRAQLRTRGVPFTERTVATQADIDALRRLAGTDSLPYVTIGQQRQPGYSPEELADLLDTAGYPKQSVLPTAYRNPAPRPLVAVAPATAASAPESGNAEAPRRRAPASAAVAPPPPPPNPAGIRF